MRLLFRPGLAQQHQVAGALFEPVQACHESSAVEGFDGTVVEPNAGPVDATRGRLLHP
ncbi:MAG: hypothetical protein OXH69_12340 [Acidobacteria bacterium]|nr:hypothetical protein [Acidobacteriota bacterium]